MKKPVICKEVAEKSLEAFKDKWDFEDPKEVVSEGKDSSIGEMRDVLVANIMMGNTEIAADGKTITHKLREPVGEEGDGIDQVTFVLTNYKQHNNRELQNAKTESDALNMFIQNQTGLTKYQFSELRGKDVAALTAIAAHLFFI